MPINVSGSISGNSVQIGGSSDITSDVVIDTSTPSITRIALKRGAYKNVKVSGNVIFIYSDGSEALILSDKMHVNSDYINWRYNARDGKLWYGFALITEDNKLGEIHLTTSQEEHRQTMGDLL